MPPQQQPQKPLTQSDWDAAKPVTAADWDAAKPVSGAPETPAPKTGATGGYGALLHFTTNAFAPFLDSAVLVFSIIGQVLMMQRRVENWAFWLLVNSIAAPLYLSRGLVLTAVLYAGFWINAIVSWRNWYKLAAQHRAASAKHAASASSVPLSSESSRP